MIRVALIFALLSYCDTGFVQSQVENRATTSSLVWPACGIEFRYDSSLKANGPKHDYVAFLKGKDPLFYVQCFPIDRALFASQDQSRPQLTPGDSFAYCATLLSSNVFGKDPSVKVVVDSVHEFRNPANLRVLEIYQTLSYEEIVGENWNDRKVFVKKVFPMFAIDVSHDKRSLLALVYWDQYYCDDVDFDTRIFDRRLMVDLTSSLVISK